MKDIRSLLVMSGSDSMNCKDANSENGLTCDLSCGSSQPVAALATEPGMNILDWTGCLIELTVTTEDAEAAERVSNSLENTENSTRTFANDQTESLTAVTSGISLASQIGQDVHQLQDIHLEDDLIFVKNTNKNATFEENLSASASFPILATNNEIDNISQSSHVSDDKNIFFLQTAESTTNKNNSQSNNTDIPILYFDLDALSLPGHQESSSEQDTDKSAITYSTDSHEISKCELMQDNLTVVNSDYLDSPISFTNVSLCMDKTDDIDIADIHPTVTVSPIYASDYSLNTPVLESLPATNHRSFVSVMSSQCTNLQFSSGSQSIKTMSPSTTGGLASFSQYADQNIETDVATVEIASQEVAFVSQASVDNSFIYDSFHPTDTTCGQIDIPCAWSEGDLCNVILPHVDPPEKCFPYSVQRTSEESHVDISLSQILISGLNTVSSEANDFHSELGATAQERYLVHEDLLELQSPHVWNSEFMSLSSRDAEDVFQLTNNTSTEFQVTNAHENDVRVFPTIINDVSIDADLRKWHYLGKQMYEAPALSSVETVVVAPNQQNLSCGSELDHCEERIIGDVSEKHRHKRPRVFTKDTTRHASRQDTAELSSKDHDQDILGPLLQRGSVVSPASPPEVQASTSLCPQAQKYTPCHKPCPSELSTDALLSPGDVLKFLVFSDGAGRRETSQMSSTLSRTVSDASDISTADYAESNTPSTASASCTDAEGPQESPAGNTLKDTLRSKLKAKRRATGMSGTVYGQTEEDKIKFSSSKSVFSASFSGENPSTSRPTWEEKTAYTVTLKSPTTQSSTSNVSRRYIAYIL